MWLVRFFFLVNTALCYFIDEKYRDASVDVEFMEDKMRNVYISFAIDGYIYSSVIRMEKIQRLGRNSFTTYNAVYTKKQENIEKSSLPSLKEVFDDVHGWFIRENATGMLSGVLVDNSKIIHIKPKQFLFPGSSPSELIAFAADTDYPEYICKPLEDSPEILAFDEPLEDNRNYFEKAAEYFKTKAMYGRSEVRPEKTIYTRIKNSLPDTLRQIVFWWDPVRTDESPDEEGYSSYDAFEHPETPEEIAMRKKRLAVQKEIEALRNKMRGTCGKCTASGALKEKGRDIFKLAEEETDTAMEEQESEEEQTEISEDISHEEVYVEETVDRFSSIHENKSVHLHLSETKYNQTKEQDNSGYNGPGDSDESSSTLKNQSSFRVKTSAYADRDIYALIEDMSSLSIGSSEIPQEPTSKEILTQSSACVVVKDDLAVCSAEIGKEDYPDGKSTKTHMSSGVSQGKGIDSVLYTHQNKSDTKSPQKKKSGKTPSKLKGKKKNAQLIQEKKDRVIGNTFVTTRIPKSNKVLKKGEVVLMGIPYYSRTAEIESAIKPNIKYGFPVETKAIPVAVAIDSHYIEKLGSKREAVFSVLENMNIASRIYERSFNVLLYVSDIIIDQSAEWYTSSGSLVQKLDHFRRYRQRKKKKCMIYHIATASSKNTAQIGLAWRGTIGYTSTRNISASIYTENQFVTMAHEIGHNLGLFHDCDEDTCRASDRVNYPCNPCDGCDCRGKYIMNSKKVPNLLSFSPPTVREMSIILSNLDAEMPKAEDVTMPYPICGNGIVEMGEECDGGPFGDACCTPDCKLRLGALCSDANSGCCQGCQPAKAGTVCRKALDECQKKSVCDGVTSKCPASSFVQNKNKCSAGFCASGLCTNKDRQCVMAGDKYSIISALPGYSGCAMKCVNKKGKSVALPEKSFRDGTPCGWNGTCMQGRCTKDLGLAAITVLAFLIGLLLVGLALM
ncbi:uncharacterized protein NESG_02394 [Nematocida ausubeli]|uniref:Disintegrin and metalloproteinase domain-containing protein B n=1 Tax=Nematocida ausubeli (strain ATCC PRA-371 / ERTm2) TaxID=1913371 RepID=A0A086IZ56_NEMA1|nr:uncharacterized protein NESG_02394 [Nematocida ausubeli]KAI5134160.1 hypothetical protein NEAUS07_0734 [Nematocida ausubeli]KFG25174.1 hypothetical protein NESG_02394 [Nematocida ausubeli]